MRYFVLHYPPLVTRKQHLLAQFEKFGIEAEWVEHWNKEDPFVQHVKTLTESPIPLGHLSAYLKWCYILDKMVKENIPNAIVFEDDVELHEEFKNLVIPHGCMYMRLGIGLACDCPHYWGSHTPIEMSGTNVHRVYNPGGVEAVWITQQYAKLALDNLNFDFTHDIADYGVLRGNMFGIPVATQSSLTSPTTTSLEPYSGDWLSYVKNYYSLKRWSFKNLIPI